MKLSYGFGLFPTVQILLLSLVLAVGAVSFFGLGEAKDEKIPQLPSEVGNEKTILGSNKGTNRLADNRKLLSMLNMIYKKTY